MHAIHTACGIETSVSISECDGMSDCMQSIPLAVLKLLKRCFNTTKCFNCMQSIPLAVLKHAVAEFVRHLDHNCMQSIPLAVLKPCCKKIYRIVFHNCMQSIPLAVLKQLACFRQSMLSVLHAIHTACGIETRAMREQTFSIFSLHAIHTACGIETR